MYILCTLSHNKPFYLPPMYTFPYKSSHLHHIYILTNTHSHLQYTYILLSKLFHQIHPIYILSFKQFPPKLHFPTNPGLDKMTILSKPPKSENRPLSFPFKPHPLPLTPTTPPPTHNPDNCPQGDAHVKTKKIPDPSF